MRQGSAGHRVTGSPGHRVTGSPSGGGTGEHACPLCNARVYSRKEWGSQFELTCPACAGSIKRPGWVMAAFILGFFVIGVAGAGATQALVYGSSSGRHSGARLVIILGFVAGALANAGIFSLLMRAFPNYRAK